MSQRAVTLFGVFILCFTVLQVRAAPSGPVGAYGREVNPAHQSQPRNFLASSIDLSKISSINLKALRHDTRDLHYRSPFGAAPAGTPVTLRLRTAHNGATSVTLEYQETDANGIPKAKGQVALKRTARGKSYDTWQTVFTPKKIDVYSYDFLIKRGKAKAWYGDTPAAEGGVGEAYKGVPAQDFHLTSYDPSFHAVPWAQDMVIYQIFPDRFFDGDTSNNNLGMNVVYNGQHTVVHKSWNEDPLVYPTPGYDEDFFGGDVRGIIDKLPYLKSLGVNTLYLNPIFLAPSDHKYDTSDYLQIDPRFGTMQDFTDLVAAVHGIGMHLILDGVFNHTSSDSVYFNQYSHFSDVGAYQSQSSPFFPWFHFTSWPNGYDSFATNLPQLQENDAVKDFIFRQPDSVAQHWLSAGSDGWRLDAATFKSHEWWQQFRQAVKSKYPNDILICECDLAPRDTVSWLMGNELDGAMNYRFRDIVLSFFAHGAGSSLGLAATATGFYNNLMSMVEEYPLPALYSSMNVVDSHDTDRILDTLGGSVAELKLVAAFQATWLGAPTVYYGDEAGLTGSGANPQLYRRPFPWSHPNMDLQAWYTKLLSIRNALQALRDGTISSLVLNNTKRLFGFVRTDSKQSVAIVFNDGSASRTISLKLKMFANGTKLVDEISGTGYLVSGGKVSIPVGATNVAVLVPAPAS